MQLHNILTAMMPQGKTCVAATKLEPSPCGVAAAVKLGHRHAHAGSLGHWCVLPMDNMDVLIVHQTHAGVLLSPARAGLEEGPLASERRRNTVHRMRGV